jgi:hypothetical protein
VKASRNIDTGFCERFDFGNESSGIDNDARADYSLLLGPQDSTGNKLQDKAIFADNNGVAGIVPAGYASDVIESAGEIVDDFAFAFITPLRTDYYD